MTASTDFTNETLVASFPLTDKTELRARLQTWNEQRRADLRVYNLYKRTGEWGPTRRGVSVPVEQLSELLELVQGLVEAAERE
jgi:hypothetical protein